MCLPVQNKVIPARSKQKQIWATVLISLLSLHQFLFSAGYQGRIKVGSCMVSYKTVSWLCRTLHFAGERQGGGSIFLGVLRQFSRVPRSCKVCLVLSLALTGSPNNDVLIRESNLTLTFSLHPQAQSIKFTLNTNKSTLHSQVSYTKPVLRFQAGSAVSS